MAKLQFALVCEAASVDQQTNQLSIFKVIESLQIRGSLPAILPKLTLVIFWVRDAQDSDEDLTLSFRFNVKSPSGTIADNPTNNGINPVFPRNSRTLRVIIDIVGVPISEEGSNQIIIEKKQGRSWVETGTIPIECTVTPLIS